MSVLLLSCNSEDILLQNKEHSVDKSTKTYFDPSINWNFGSSTSYNPGPIYQLDGIPVHIKNNGKYLGISYNGSIACLYDKDDGSGKQRWIIGNRLTTPQYDEYEIYTYAMRIISGAVGNKNILGSVVEDTNKANKNIVMIDKNNTSTHWDWDFKYLSDKDCYQIKTKSRSWQYPKPYYTHLTAHPSNDYATYIDYDNNSESQLWEIQPIETYNLLNVEWRLNPEDVISALPDFIQETTVNNQSSMTQNMTATYTKTASETSSFSKTEGLSISINVSAKIGVPIISGSGIDVNRTTSTTWQYGTTETQQDQRSYSFPLSVPPYTSITSKAMVQMSKLTATYVAKFKGNTTGKILTLEGKWEGVQAGNIYYEIRENSTGKVLRVVNGTPKSTLLF